MDNIIIYNTDDGAAKVSLYSNDGTVWLTQAQISELFNKEVSTISRHIANIFDEHEVEEKSNLRFMQIANSDKPVAFYSLNVILAVGFRVRSSRGTEFRRWANTTLREYLQKGFLIDDERLKNPDGRPDYFDELLARIRDIRASEKRFYQKLRDLFALSVDYDKTEHGTQLFFADIQNKLIFAVTGKTAADLICARADASVPNNGKERMASCPLRHQHRHPLSHHCLLSRSEPLGSGRKDAKGEITMSCFMCKGSLEEKKTMFMVDLGAHIIIIKDVPSFVCSQCGDTTYSDEVAHVLEQIVESLRHAPTEMSVVNYEHRPAA